MHKNIQAFLAVIFALCFIGCPATQEVRKPEPAPETPAVKRAPEITIELASLDLTRFGKKIEPADVVAFAGLLRKEKIDILLLEGISRYPGLTTRVDIVDALSHEAGMRQAFGETINLSGKQGGNAVFSVYPIRSSENTHYSGLQSDGFEAALQAIIDCGARDVVVVSTRIPRNASGTDQTIAGNLLGTLPALYVNHPVIIAGHLPHSGEPGTTESFNEVQEFRSADSPRVWFSSDGSLELLRARVQNTIFGSLAIAEFGIFRQTSP